MGRLIVPNNMKTTIFILFALVAAAGTSALSQDLNNAATTRAVTKFVPPTYPPLAKTARIQGDVLLAVEISPNGSVTNVKVLSGHPLLVFDIVATVRQWSFDCSSCEQPVEQSLTVSFLFERSKDCSSAGDLNPPQAEMTGHDRVVVHAYSCGGPERKKACIESLSGFPSELRATPEPAIPAQGADAAIVYFESGCFGNCPAFTMTLRRNSVEFDGHAYVRAKGKHSAKSDPAVFDALLRAWLDRRFFAMRDDYCEVTCDGVTTVVTDIPESSIELLSPSYKKRVYECYSTVDDKPIKPRPPQQYFEFRQMLIEFAKSKGWL